MRLIRVELFLISLLVLAYCCQSLFNNWRSETGFRKLRSLRGSFSRTKPKTSPLLEAYESRLFSALITAPLLLTMSSFLFSFPILPLLLLAPIAFSRLSTLRDIRDVLTDETTQEMIVNAFQKASRLFKLVKKQSNSLPLGTSNQPNLAHSESQLVSNSTPQPLDSFSASPSLRTNSTLHNLSSPGFLSQLSSIDDMLNNNQPSDDNLAALQNLTSNTLDQLSYFLFNNQRSEPFQSITKQLPQLTRLSTNYFNSPFFVKNLVKNVNSILLTLKDGLRRYDLSESECQTRLICELNHKAIGRSLRSWMTTLLEFFGLEEQLKSASFTARTKSILRDFYEVAKKGLNEEECALNYSKCPTSIAIEPFANSLLANFFKRRQTKTKSRTSSFVASKLNSRFKFWPFYDQRYPSG